MLKFCSATTSMHILRMTCIHHRHSLTIKRIRKVPLVFVRHVISFPTRQRRLTPQQTILNTIYREDGFACISLQILLVVSVSILLRHITIKREYLPRSSGLDDILQVSHWHISHLSPQPLSHTTAQATCHAARLSPV